MSTTYKISFRAKLKDSLSLQRLHDCLKKLNVKHWAYDFQNLVLSLQSEFPDFRSIQSALRSAGFRCNFVKMENVESLLAG